MKRFFYAVVCFMVAVVANAQFTEPGFYRVHNAGSDRYISIKGTHYEKSSDPDAFWPCILMQQDSDQVSDPGTIIYIPNMGQASLYAQGVNTYSLTGLMLEIDTAKVRENGLPTYVAKTTYNNFPCIFRDYGNGLTAGFLEKPESHWWIEPVNEGSIDTSFLGVKPVNEKVQDAEGWYWTTMCCDYPFVLPIDGGVEGAYTVKEIKMGTDSLYYAEPVLLCGQGDTVPAATPVLLKCKEAFASGNKVIPVGEIANQREMPIVGDLLMGNYFSIFTNHSNLTEYDVLKDYIPAQATMAAANYLALGVDEEGKLGFYPQEDSTYMAANTAWLSLDQMEDNLQDVSVVYLGIAPTPDPEPQIVMGDADGDGIVSIKDVTALITYLLDYRVGVDPDDDAAKNEEINVLAADMDGDGELSIRDVTLLINYLLENNRID